MALMACALASAINEASGAIPANGYNAYEFVACTMDEAMDEAAIIFMDEHADLVEYETSSNEIMYEAALTNPDSLEAISESVFSNAIAKLKELVKKAIEVAKGVLNKIKAGFFKLTKQYSQFVSSIRPRIDTARNKAGFNDIKVMMYQWNQEYVTKTLPASAATISSKYGVTLNSDIDAIKAQAQKEIDDATASTARYSGDNKMTAPDDAELRADVFKTVSSAFGTGSSLNDTADMAEQITAKARGGKDKVDVACGSMADAMMTALESAKTTQAEIEKNYNQHISQLSKLHSKIDEAQKAAEKKKEEAKVDATTREAFTAMCNAMSKKLTITEGILNKANHLNVRLLKEMFRDYASALTVLAKGPKKSA